MELDLFNGAIPVIALFLTNWFKRIFGGTEWFERALPMVPVLIAFALSFIPGLGLAEQTIGAKLLFAFGAGGVSAIGHEAIKRTVKGDGMSRLEGTFK